MTVSRFQEAEGLPKVTYLGGGCQGLPWVSWPLSQLSSHRDHVTAVHIPKQNTCRVISGLLRTFSSFLLYVALYQVGEKEMICAQRKKQKSYSCCVGVVFSFTVHWVSTEPSNRREHLLLFYNYNSTTFFLASFYFILFIFKILFLSSLHTQHGV